MNLAGFEKIAKYLAVPLVLVGFVLMLVFGIHSELIKSGLLPQVSQEDAGIIIRLMLHYGFRLGLCVTVLGVGLTAWIKYIDKMVQPVDAEKLAAKLLEPLQGQLQAKDEQIKALTEAINALSKADAPAKDINAALRALEQGDTREAQAIFAEVLCTKEAEGVAANKEAAAAARHLGALAYPNDTKVALAAYQKAVQLDPDNAIGWNRLGLLLWRTGELVQAETAFRKMLALAEAHQDKEKQAAVIGNLGILAYTRGDLDKAKEMHRKALELHQALGHKEGMAADYGNLGIVAYTRGDLDKAEVMHWKALELHQVLGHKESMARDYGNLGIVYADRGDLDKAEEMYRKAFTLNDALGRKEGMAANYANLGSLYKIRGNLVQAEELWQKSLRLYQEMGAMQHPDAMKVQRWLDKLA